ncbi:cytochrome P450 [Colletotrichum caudatum]|nr:cytochrome P450 [Colletotrichum caudatum]
MEIQSGGSRVSAVIFWPLAAVSLGLAVLLLTILYNVTLHPLRKYPGPKLWAATRIPYALMIVRGDPHKTILALHRRYGADVVRISPNELSFQHPDAWKDIMGHRGGGGGGDGGRSEENEKDPDVVDERRMDIVSARRGDHARYRRILSHSFSARSMQQDQQPIILPYVDLLMKRLRGAAGRGPVDMVAWYNSATFDIIGDLAFGEPFGCLDRPGGHHPWVRVIFENIRMLALVNLARSFRLLAPLLKMLVPRDLIEKGKSHRAFVRDKVDRRMALGTPRPDFAESMMKKGNEVSPLSQDEIYENSGLLVIAGSETTATALSGATYLLAANPHTLARLSAEVRGSFASEDEIDFLGTARLGYLHAVLEESLRMYPPVPTAVPRRTPPRGAEILGQWIPGNTTIGIAHWPLYHNERLFSRPFGFHPERWLGDPAFAGDRLDAFRPFHVGPRNCIGMNLAYAEMRVMLARVVWAFDLRLAEASRGWMDDQRCYILWRKAPLMVHLTPRRS